MLEPPVRKPSRREPQNGLGDVLAHSVKETGRRSTVHDAMIKGQAECNHLAGNDLPLVYGRLADYAPNPQNGCLGQIDDGGEGVNAEHAQICDRESSALHRIMPQAFLVRTLDQAGSLSCYRAQRLCGNVSQYRSQQALISFDRKADVDSTVKYQSIIAPTGIERGMFLQRGGCQFEIDVVVARYRQSSASVAGLQLLT